MKDNQVTNWIMNRLTIFRHVNLRYRMATAINIEHLYSRAPVQDSSSN